MAEVVDDMNAKVESKTGVKLMNAFGGAVAGAKAGVAIAAHCAIPLAAPLAAAKIIVDQGLRSNIADKHARNLGVIDGVFGNVKTFMKNGERVYDRSSLCSECAARDTRNEWWRESKKLSKGLF